MAAPTLENPAQSHELALALRAVLEAASDPLVSPSELAGALLSFPAWQEHLAAFQPGRGQAAAVGRYLRSLGLRAGHDRARGSVYLRADVATALRTAETLSPFVTAADREIVPPSREIPVAAPAEADEASSAPGLVYGMAPIALRASGGDSGQPIAFRVLAGPAAIVDGRLAVSGAGTIVVEASQPGDENFEPAPPVQFSYSVAKAPLLARAENIEITWGEPLPTLRASFHGFVNGDDESASFAAPLELTLTPADPGRPGSYAIRARGETLLAANYDVEFIEGRLLIAPAPQTIDFRPLPDCLYGCAPLELHAEGGPSGAPVTFHASGPARVEAGRLRIVGAGEVTVEARQAGNEYYAAAPPVLRSLTVRKAPLTIAAVDAACVFGAPPPVLAARASGLLNGDTLEHAVTGRPELATVPPAPTTAGVYPIHAAAGDLQSANYEFAFASGLLRITSAPQIVTFDELAAATYGAPPLPLSASGGGSGQPVEFRVVDGPGSLRGALLAIDGAGQITVEATQRGDANHQPAAPVRRSLTVAKAMLTVTGTRLSIPYGTPVPPYSAALTGFVNGDTEAAAVTGTPDLSTVPEEPRAVGQYPIVTAVGRLRASNYGFRCFDGLLTITRAAQNIRFEALENTVYGGPEVALRATAPADGPVQFHVVSGPAVIHGDRLEVRGAGLITVEANHSGDGTYLPAAPARQAFSAAKAPLLVVAEDRIVIYGEPVGATGRSLAAAAAAGAEAAPFAFASRVQRAVASLPWFRKRGDGSGIAAEEAISATEPAPGEPEAAQPGFSFRLEGFVHGDSAGLAVAGAPRLRTEPAEPRAAGSYPIRAELGSLRAQHYEFRFVDGQLTIAKAPQSICFSPLPALRYGAPPQPLHAEGGGSGQPVSFHLLSGPASVERNRLVLHGAGRVVIEARQPGDANHLDAEPVQQTIEIAKARLTVGATNLQLAYGLPVPAPELEYSGFVNGDESAAATLVRGAAQIAFEPPEPHRTGTYAIVVRPGSLLAENYDFDARDGVLTIVPAEQVLSLDPARPLTYGCPPLRLGARGGASGEPIGFHLLGGPGRIDGDRLTVLGAGTISIEARQAGNANFAAAAPVRQSMAVAKARLTVSAAPIVIGYGALTPACSASFEGFVNGDSAATAIIGEAAFPPPAVTPMAAGRYPILPGPGTLHAENYEFHFVKGELTILPAPQTIHFPALENIVYGAPGVRLSAAGGASGEPVTYAVISGSARIEGDRLYPTAAGELVIEARQAGAPNYLPAVPVRQRLMVAKATLTVSVVGVNLGYGEPVPSPAFTISGLVLGDTPASAFSGAPAILLDAPERPGPGTYAMRASRGSLQSSGYDFRFVDASLTIAKAPQRVHFRLPSGLTYGDAPVALTGEGGPSNRPIEFRLLAGPGRLRDACLEITGAGVLEIEASQRGDANYLAAPPVVQSCRVAPAVLTVAAESATCSFGAPLPPLRAAFHGWIGADSPANALTGTPELAVEPPPTAAGSFPILARAGSLQAANYTFRFLSGTLTVRRAQQAIRLGEIVQPSTNGTHAIPPSEPALAAETAPPPAAEPAALEATVAERIPVGKFAHLSDGSVWTKEADGTVRQVRSAGSRVETGALAAAVLAAPRPEVAARIPVGKFAHLSDGSVWTRDADETLRRVQ